MINIWIYLCKNKLNNKFEYKIQLWNQKFQILT